MEFWDKQRGTPAPLWTIAFAVALASLLACQAAAEHPSYPWLESAVTNRTLQKAIAPPHGYQRTAVAKPSYGAWLRDLPLKQAAAPVKLYTGRLKPNQRAHHAVVELDTGNRNLQQCADAAIRLYSEFLWSQKRQNDIAFHITNGMWVPWKRWAAGHRVRVKRGGSKWTTGSSTGRSRKQFARYLRFIMGYAGTASLARRLPKRTVPQLAIGDLLIQGGFPGHAVVVLDMAKNPQGDTLILLGQSYMPAQDFHVLKNPTNRGLSPWYQLSDIQSSRGIRTPEWRPFHAKDLRAMKPTPRRRR